MDNGLQVELLPPGRSEKAAVALLLNVGADHDPPGRSGMAHLVEHLFSTTDRAGGSHALHGEVGAEHTFYAVEVPAWRLTEEIDGLAARMSRLPVTGDDVTRQRTRLLDDLRDQWDGSALSTAMNIAADAVRPTRGEGARGGKPSEVEKMTLAEVEQFLNAAYGAANARLVVAGGFDQAEVAERIRTAFGRVPAGKAPQARPPAASQVTGTMFMLGGMGRAVALAVPVPAVKDPLYPAFLILAARLTAPAAQAPARTWKADFAPLTRPDILFVTRGIPDDQGSDALATRMRAEVNTIVTAPLAAGEAGQALAKLDGVIGLAPVTAASAAAAPQEAAIAAGRRAQLGIDPPALKQAILSATPDQLAAAARLFDEKSSAAVIREGVSLP